MPGPRAVKSENGFFRCDTWLQIFQNDSKICEADVTVTPLINKICNPWIVLPFIYFLIPDFSTLNFVVIYRRQLLYVAGNIVLNYLQIE